MLISVNADPLEPTIYFTYLGCTVAYNNSNWDYLYHNLRKAQSQWGVVEKVVTKTGSTVRAWGVIYKSVVCTVLLYGGKIWVVTWSMLKLLEGFHNWASISIVGNTSRITTFR